MRPILGIVSLLIFSPAVPGLGTSLPRVPKGLTVVDWGQIRAEYERHRHGAFPDGEGLQARNFGQQWLTRFDGRGFSVQPDGGSWQWGLELAGVSGKARVSSDVNRITYQWNDGLEEWFVNGTRGLEHGFTVQEPREIRLVVRGGLQPRAAESGAEFVDAGGMPHVKYTELSVRDADGRFLTARMQVERGTVVLAWDDRGARYPVTIDPIAQQAYLKASNTGAGDSFGFSVAVSGDTVVVGAIGEDCNSTGVNGYQSNKSSIDSGAAYVFVRSGATWYQEAYLKASNTDPGDAFGWSVAVSGDTIVVGAAYEASNATGVDGNQSDNSLANSGAAYVFVRSAGLWTQQAYLKASNSGTQDYFGGTAVSVSGDTVVVAAAYEDSDATGVNGDQSNNNLPQSGAVYVFVRNGVTWTQQAYLKAANPGHNDAFGFSLAVSGDTVVVGAVYEDSNAVGVNGDQSNNSVLESGAAYVFFRSGATWSQQAYLKASNTGTNDGFGYSVAISADTVVVGAYQESSDGTGVNGNQGNNNGPNSGAAYVFVRSGAMWTQQAYLKASKITIGALFGSSVAVSGDTVAVGAPKDSFFAPNSGAAYVFRRNGFAWTQDAYLKAPWAAYTEYGNSVAASGDTVVVGAKHESSNATGVNGDDQNESALDSGAAYVFAPPPCPFATVQVTAPAAVVAEGDFDAGVPLTVTTTGHAVPLSFSSYATDANGVTISAPAPGVPFYSYWDAQAPIGPPVVGGTKLVTSGADGVVGYPFGALMGVWVAKGANWAYNSPFLVGSNFQTQVPNVASSGGARLYVFVNGTFVNSPYALFTSVMRDGGCRVPAAISLTHRGNFIQGQTGATYTITVSNPTGVVPTNGAVTVTEPVPSSLTLMSMSGNGWTCSANICTRSDALQGGVAYPPITVTMSVASNAPASLVNTASVTGGGSATVSTTDSTTILPSFTDTFPADFFFNAVNLMAQCGITGGCSLQPPMYCPNDNVSRGQMAVFVVRSVMGGDTFIFSATPHFTDVPANHPYFKYVQKMFELGITAGCGGGNYCPNDNVTRGQMAVFVIRARLGAAADGTFTYPASPSFSDVPANHPYFKWIQRMKRDLITAGCGGTSYCPDDPVTRGQMAIFVMRGSFNLLLPAGTTVLASATPAAMSLLETVTVTLSGDNTNFAQGLTTVTAGPGITVGAVTVLSPTSLSVPLTTTLVSRPFGPRTLVAVTGSEEAVLPNGFNIR